MTPEQDALLQAGQEFTVEVAETPEMIEAAFRLRYQVYCRERSYEQSQDRRETDHFDQHARHAILIQCRTGRVVGTVRVVSGLCSAGPGLPIQRLLPANLLQTLPPVGTGEVSRFAISKELRDTVCASDALLRLGLMRGVVHLSSLMDLTHWCAVMEPSLLRLLRVSGIHFQPLGPVIEYHGLRQPCMAPISVLLSRMRHERPMVWNYITAAGALWREPETEVA